MNNELEEMIGDGSMVFTTTCLSALKDKLLKITDNDKFFDNTYIAGGCIRDFILREPVQDVDIFIEKHKEDVVEIVTDSLSTMGIYHYKSDNAIGFTFEGYKFQIITCETGNPHDVAKKFDFTMNSNFYKLDSSGTIYIKSINDIKNKQLVFNKECRNLLGTLGRVPKFVNRGWKVPTKLDMVWLGCQISRLEPVNKLSYLEEESRLCYNNEEYADMGGWSNFTFDRAPKTRNNEASGA